MKIEFTVWKVEDSHGNTDSGVVNVDFDVVEVIGLHGYDNGRLWFENELRHLALWCEGHDLSLTTEQKSVSI